MCILLWAPDALSGCDPAGSVRRGRGWGVAVISGGLTLPTQKNQKKEKNP